ncbi:hypothetical protein [Pseudescherichia vulneris]|uniref:hypothetical protein n=1 Tax=Pseudescherichia vulneris TaxID=566 RepID=UPI0028D29CBA|nr:hypothetical protein [Pseudescherichia vulneris]
MAVYKITYQVSGDSSYRDVNIESDHVLTKLDDEVIEAANRDSVNFTPSNTASSLVGIRIITVTEVK